MKSLHSISALRPLLMVSRLKVLKQAMHVLTSSLGNMINIMLITLLFLLICGIFSLNFFKGLNYGCICPDDVTADQINLMTYPIPYTELSEIQKTWFPGSYNETTSKAVCLWMECSWKNTYHCKQNFNNIFQSVSTLFQMLSLEGWTKVMHIATDNRGIDMQPISDYRLEWCTFFIIFIIIGSFFLTKMFIGVVIDNFNTLRLHNSNENSFLTPEQREWVNMKEALLALKIKRPLKRPRNAFRKFCFKIVITQSFEILITILIIINTIILGMHYLTSSFAYSNTLDILSETLAWIFTVEMIMKLIGLGFRQYFKSGWNIFDFIVTIGADVGYILMNVYHYHYGVFVVVSIF